VFQQLDIFGPYQQRMCTSAILFATLMANVTVSLQYFGVRAEQTFRPLWCQITRSTSYCQFLDLPGDFYPTSLPVALSLMS
jgi:hypothetical protein